MTSNGKRYTPAFKLLARGIVSKWIIPPAEARGVENPAPSARVVLEAIKAEGKGGEAQVARSMECVRLPCPLHLTPHGSVGALQLWLPVAHGVHDR